MGTPKGWKMASKDGDAAPFDGQVETVAPADFGLAAAYQQTREMITLSPVDANAAVDFAAAMERAGLTEDDAIVGSAYEPVEKDELIGVPFLIVTLAYNRDQVTDREYLIARCVTKQDPSRMVVFTDGGTGVARQLAGYVRERLATGQPAWEGYYIAHGLRVSEYPVHKDGTPLSRQEISDGVKPSSVGRTFYIA